MKQNEEKKRKKEMLISWKGEFVSKPVKRAETMPAAVTIAVSVPQEENSSTLPSNLK